MKQKQVSFSFRLVVVTVLLFLAHPAVAQEQQKIRISYSSRSNSTMVYHVAAAKGLFKEEGLEVEMIQMNPRLGALAVMNGEVEFTTTFGSTLRGIVQGGLPLKFVAISVRRTDHFLIARPEIKSVQELRGKRFGVSTLFGTDQLAGEEMMSSKGLKPGQLSVVALGDAPVRTQALRTGIVDVIAINAPFDMTLVKAGFSVLAGPSDVRRALPLAGLAARDRLIREKPQVIKRVLRAVLKAHKYVFEHKQETMRIMMQWLNQPQDVAARSYDVAMGSLSKNGEIPDADMEILTEKKRPLDEVRDYSLLREVQKELGID
jgi:ABC-type nitrate/sulfonate/bicarbonate transport system substrate-binding protein